jgi:hypothetical protein
VIASAVRTPIGAFQGSLASLTGVELGVAAATAAIARSGIAASAVDEAILGNVLGAAQGQAPAHQVAIGAGYVLALFVQSVTTSLSPVSPRKKNKCRHHLTHNLLFRLSPSVDVTGRWRLRQSTRCALRA